jgi:hypothetical protein
MIPAQANISLVLGSTDMRKSIDGLALIVADLLNMDAFSGQLFVFCNRTRNISHIPPAEPGACIVSRSKRLKEPPEGGLEVELKLFSLSFFVFLFSYIAPDYFLIPPYS